VRDNLSRVVPPLSRSLGGRTFPPSPYAAGAHPHLPGSANSLQSKNDPQADLNAGKVDSIGGRVALFESENRVS